MITWLQKHAWWVSVIIALLIALFPNAFANIGNVISNFIARGWMPTGMIIIIILLIILVAMNTKRAS